MGMGEGEARFLINVFGDLLPDPVVTPGRRFDPRDAGLLSATLLSFDAVLSERAGGVGRRKGIATSVFLVFCSLVFCSLAPEGVLVTVPTGSWRLEGIAFLLTTAPTRVALKRPDERGRLSPLDWELRGDGSRAGGRGDGPLAGGRIEVCRREARCAAFSGITAFTGTGTTGLPGLDLAHGRLEEVLLSAIDLVGLLAMGTGARSSPACD